MFGAILGDIIGSSHEFKLKVVSKNEFELFNKKSRFTDDTVMSVAISDALLETGNDASDEGIKASFISYMKKYGRKYITAGYGKSFLAWLVSNNENAYGSFGNGSAMRVSSIPYYCSDSLEMTRHIAKLSAEVTHNHPEGIKGAESVASAIWMALHNSTKEDIAYYIKQEFGYDLSKTCEEIIGMKIRSATCQDTVPYAIIAFLESSGFEDAIRNAVSFGGDTDTLAAVAGSIAEAYYGIPEELEDVCLSKLDSSLRVSLLDFERVTERAIWTDLELRQNMKLNK